MNFRHVGFVGTLAVLGLVVVYKSDDRVLNLPAGHYCIASSEGDKVYAPGRRNQQNEMLVIWNGRLHEIPEEHLVQCDSHE